MDFDISVFLLYVAGVRAHGVVNLPGAVGQKVECRIETINVCTEKLISIYMYIRFLQVCTTSPTTQ